MCVTYCFCSFSFSSSYFCLTMVRSVNFSTFTFVKIYFSSVISVVSRLQLNVLMHLPSPSNKKVTLYLSSSKKQNHTFLYSMSKKWFSLSKRLLHIRTRKVWWYPSMSRWLWWIRMFKYDFKHIYFKRINSI